MGDYYWTLIGKVDYRIELLSGKEYIGIEGLRDQYYNLLCIDSPYNYDRSYVLEEAKELLPLFLHPDQFCDLAMIAPELRDEIKLKYNEKYKDDKDFDERYLQNIENKMRRLSAYN